MLSNDDFKAIAELDLDPIKVKLMHEASGEGWSLEKATAVEAEYRRFLILMKKFPEEQTAPLFDVDTFWHYHILDTMKYAQDCQRIFGYFLHHFPYIGLRGEEDEAAHERVGQRMKELYEETFGEPYIKGEAAYSGHAVEKTAYSGHALAMTAYSGHAVQKVAYSGHALPRTAYSGHAVEKVSSWGKAINKTAYSGHAVEKVAYSGHAIERTAYSGGAIAPAALDAFYTTRPTLPRAA